MYVDENNSDEEMFANELPSGTSTALEETIIEQPHLNPLNITPRPSIYRQTFVDTLIEFFSQNFNCLSTPWWTGLPDINDCAEGAMVAVKIASSLEILVTLPPKIENSLIRTWHHMHGIGAPGASTKDIVRYNFDAIRFAVRTYGVNPTRRKLWEKDPGEVLEALRALEEVVMRRYG